MPKIEFPWFRAVVATYFLPIWFTVFAVRESLIPIIRNAVGGDALLYQRAAQKLMSGASPYEAYVSHAGRDYHFYAAPSVAVLFAPFTFVPAWLFVPLFVGVQGASAVYIVRRLRLTWWWLLFPPLVSGVAWGNPSILVVALLLASSPLLKALAPLIKTYAGFPLLGEFHWRAIIIAAAIGIVTVALAPSAWYEFLAESGSRTTQLLAESTGGFTAVEYPGVLISGIAATAIIALHDRRMAGWLAPIAFWPGSQFHWSTLGMPVMNPWLAVTLAIPSHAMPVLAVVGVAWWMLVKRVLRR